MPNPTILLSKQLWFICPVFSWNLYSKYVYFRLKNSNGILTYLAVPKQIVPSNDV